jgi:hypothetical protein
MARRENGVNMLLLAFTHHTGVRLAEVGFLFILLAGGWLAAASVGRLKSGTLVIVGGAALGLGALLLIIAIHWGHFN